MKRLLIGVLGLLCAQMACAECVEVTPDPYKTLTPLASSGTVQITVNLDGKPLPNAKVIHMPGFKPYPVVFRILQAGDTKEFLAVLQIGSC